MEMVGNVYRRASTLSIKSFDASASSRICEKGRDKDAILNFDKILLKFSHAIDELLQKGGLNISETLFNFSNEYFG